MLHRAISFTRASLASPSESFRSEEKQAAEEEGRWKSVATLHWLWSVIAEDDGEEENGRWSCSLNHTATVTDWRQDAHHNNFGLILLPKWFHHILHITKISFWLDFWLSSTVRLRIKSDWLRFQAMSRVLEVYSPLSMIRYRILYPPLERLRKLADTQAQSHSSVWNSSRAILSRFEVILRIF